MRELIEKNQKLNKLINEFIDNGFEIYFVGGVVRDYLLNREIHDIDFTTSASPDEMIEMLGEDYKLNLNGLKHGTVGVIINGKMYEITTFRTEGGYLDKRHPDYVRFVKNIYEDLARRDYTINALAVSLQNDNEIIDYFDGQKDLENHLIRTVLNPDRRFNEDALRILRALRFASTLSFDIENKTKESIFKNYHLLDDISSERIVDEIKRMIVQEKFNDIFKEFHEVFEYILGLDLNIEKVDLIYNAINKLDSDYERLSLLFYFSKEDSNNLDRLRFSNFEKGIIINSVKIANELVNNDKEMRTVFRKYPTRFVLCGVKVKGAIDGKTEDYLRLYEANKGKPNHICDLKINGFDLIKNKIRKKKIGILLSRLLDEVIDEKLNNDYDSLMKRSIEIEEEIHLQND